MSSPVCISNCADCGVGCITAGAWFSVWDDVWEQAWAGRRKPWHGKVIGQEILCVGCLEKRIFFPGVRMGYVTEDGFRQCCDDCRQPLPAGPQLHDELWATIAKPEAYKTGAVIRDATTGKISYSNIFEFTDRATRDAFSRAVIDVVLRAFPDALEAETTP